MNVCIYDSHDFDGVASACVARSHGYTLIPHMFGAPSPKLPEFTESLLVADIYYHPEDMLRDAQRLRQHMTWIDHHDPIRTHGDDLRRYGVRVVDTRPEAAACLGVWRHFHDVPPPPSLQEISNYDIWRHGERTLAHQMGLEATYPLEPLDNGLLEYVTSFVQARRRYDKMCDDGAIVLRWAQTQWARTWKTRHTVTLLDEKGTEHLMFAVNTQDPRVFTVAPDAWGIAYYRTSYGWHCSLRAGNNCDVDLGSIARRYAGNGRSGTAGFVCNELPWSSK